MKADIHPAYQDCVITCACGAVYRVRSTKPSYRIEVCGACHPFYTGTQRVVDTGGRVERFRRKYEAYELAQARAQADGEAAKAEPEPAEKAEVSAKELLTKVAEARKAAEAGAQPAKGAGRSRRKPPVE